MIPLLANPALLKYLAIVLAVLGIAGASWYKGYTLGKDVVEGEKQEILKQQAEDRAAAEKKWAEDLAREVAKNNELSIKLEDALKKRTTTTKEVIKYVRKEIEKPVYRECVVPPSGVSTLGEISKRYNRERKESNTSKPAR